MSTEIDALEQNLWSMWGQFGGGSGCRLLTSDDTLLFETPIPITPYNSVLRFTGPLDQVPLINASYANRGVAPLWWVHPTATAGLTGHLRSDGLVCAEHVSGMVADLAVVAPPAASPAEIVEVEDTSLADYLELVSWRFSVPGRDTEVLESVVRAAGLGPVNRAWVARLNGRPVAKAWLHRACGVAGIYGIATRPEARKLGIAGCLTSTALQAAKEEGEQVAVLHATPMARALYEGLGFRFVAGFEVWAPPGGTPWLGPGAVEHATLAGL
jgi:ribosomal protein S18 acetylase RimI-like enzyme